MKKLLSLALALVLALGLGCPAWAVDGISPEEEARIVEQYGLEVPDTTIQLPDGDFGYTVIDPDPLPENWWMDDVLPEDPFVEYMQAHPEELADLDTDALLAGWGYVDRTPGEWFLAYEGKYGETLEEAVQRTYIEKRQEAVYNCTLAEEYRAEYPKEWEKFNADSYFEREWMSDSDSVPDKAAYMARYNLLTETEFVDDMFVMYVQDNRYSYDFDRSNYKTPTLVLYVNGVVTDVEVTAGEGVTYADADALRQFFGPEAVPADATGLLPIRETAQAAGWDVGWYANRWSGEQEVQLWDKGSYEAYLAEEFGPLNDFFAKLLKTGGNVLFGETPVSTRQTATVELTRFSTLDGDKTYPLTLEVDATMGGGVADMTVTFDVSELLKAFPADALESLTKLGGFSATQLKQFLKAGVMEFIVDYNTGELAYNVPLLALFDETLAGWQSETLPGLDSAAEMMDGLEEFSFTSTLYAQLTTTASYAGAQYALDQYDGVAGVLSVFAGKDRFTTQNGKTTYALTTRAMNEALSALINAELEEEGETDRIAKPVYSFFKAFDVNYTLDEAGNVTANLHIRPDMDGIANAAAKAYESGNLYGNAPAGVMEIVMGWVMKVWDVDLTAASQGNATRATGSVDVHWNNVGKVSVRTTAAQTTGKAPRSVGDVVK